MARVTVEDCLLHVENRFALVHTAAKRAKQMFLGSAPLVECKNRQVVTALREIADGLVEVKMPERREPKSSRSNRRNRSAV